MGRWREVNRNKHMKGHVLRALQKFGDKEDEVSGKRELSDCKNGDELYELYPELFLKTAALENNQQPGGNLLPIFKDISLATIKGAYIAILLSLQDHEKLACNEIYNKGDAYFK